MRNSLSPYLWDERHRLHGAPWLELSGPNSQEVKGKMILSLIFFPLSLNSVHIHYVYELFDDVLQDFQLWFLQKKQERESCWRGRVVKQASQ